MANIHRQQETEKDQWEEFSKNTQKIKLSLASVTRSFFLSNLQQNIFKLQHNAR